MASLGPGVMSELRLVPPAFGAEPEQSLTFGDMEPLVRLLQETPVERLQGSLLQELENGRDLKTLIAAGASLSVLLPPTSVTFVRVPLDGGDHTPPDAPFDFAATTDATSCSAIVTAKVRSKTRSTSACSSR